MFLRIWNYFRGYVIIEVIGFSVERFVNLAAHKDIFLWDVKPVKNKITMKVSVKDFRKLKSCAKKTNSHIKIIKKYGCPFFIFRYRKRKFFAFGVVLFIIVLYTLSSFIWLIEIEGNERIESQQILEFCEQQGFKIGAFKSKINPKELEKTLKNNFTDLSWITVQIHGTKATIKLKETIPKLEIEDKSTPCNIIAKSNALIYSIATKKGTPQVKAQDVVAKGDILVSGELTIIDDETSQVKEYVHSDADIKAKLWYILKTSVPYKHTEKNYTGKAKKRYNIILFNKYINLPNFKINYENYDKIVSRKQLSAGKNFALPIIIVTEQYKEYILSEETYTKEEAKQIAEKSINKEILNKFDINTDIIDKKLNFSETKTSIDASAIITVIEDIGIEQPISDNNINNNNDRSENINGTTENTDTQ